MAGRELSHRGAPSRLAPAALAIAVVVSLALAAPASAALECGDTITTDKTLHENLDCPAATDGITFGAAGIKLDLNGHKISGPAASGYSAVVVPGYNDAKIINGKLRGFGNGIEAATMSGLTLRKLDVKHTAEDSISLISVQEAEVKDDVLGDPGNQVNLLVDGILAENVVLSDSTLGGGKVHFAQGQGLSAIGNELDEPIIGGIDVDDVTGAVVRRNRILKPGIAAGIAVNFETEDARIGRNVVRGGNSTGIAVLLQSQQIRVTHNDVRNSDGSGILVGVMTTGTVIRKNLVKQAGLDGITVQDDDALIEDNTANRNGDYGIESASSNGSGNTARNNGNPAECTPASLCT